MPLLKLPFMRMSPVEAAFIVSTVGVVPAVQPLIETPVVVFPPTSVVGSSVVPSRVPNVRVEALLFTND